MKIHSNPQPRTDELKDGMIGNPQPILLQHMLSREAFWNLLELKRKLKSEQQTNTTSDGNAKTD